jgi:hypothetical protein
MQTRICDKAFPSRRTVITSALLALLSLPLFLAGCGGGGGGGGGGSPVTVTGKVLRAETGLAPNPAATVTIGGQTATAGADGTFTLNNVSSSTTTATISAQGTQTLTLPITLTAPGPNNLGDIYLSDTGYNATVTGRVVTQVNGQAQPVGNANVVIAGQHTVTATDGTFTLNNLPVGLGTVNGIFGKITATGFDDKLITADILRFPLTAGSNPLGDILMGLPIGNVPPPPYTITGTVTVKGTATAGIEVALAANGVTLGTTTTDSNGHYFFWVVPSTYTLTAIQGSATQQTNVTLNRLDTPVTASTINLTP